MKQTICNLVEAKAAAARTILRADHSTVSIAETSTGGLLSAFLSTDPVCFGGGYVITPRCYDALGISPTIAISGPDKLAAFMSRNCLQQTKTDWAIALAGADKHACVAIANNRNADIYPLQLGSSDNRLQLCSVALSLFLVSVGSPYD